MVDHRVLQGGGEVGRGCSAEGERRRLLRRFRGAAPQCESGHGMRAVTVHQTAEGRDPLRHRIPARSASRFHLQPRVPDCTIARMASEDLQPRRDLTLTHATSLVVGIIIGTGIFLKSATMAQAVGTPALLLAAWAAAGLVAMLGALCFAELGALLPHEGGEYVYLRSAYGEIPGFLFAAMPSCSAAPRSPPTERRWRYSFPTSIRSVLTGWRTAGSSSAP